MKTTSVSHLKNNLSARLKEVASGEAILVTDRKKPVATLQPVGVIEQGDLSRLCAEGVVSPARRKLNVKAFLKRSKAECDRGLTTVILEEREGR